ncbi:MAG TPA: BrnA antitoxin family protein [Candidatus Limnocylindrales bacterium]|nr:BrnA antitoxin family protein [Candidatus Limnocylindrales bacterium]
MIAIETISRRYQDTDVAAAEERDGSAQHPQGITETVRGGTNKGGRPTSSNPRKLISLRLPADVIARWRATGPGWQTRMADRLSKVRL